VIPREGVESGIDDADLGPLALLDNVVIPREGVERRIPQADRPAPQELNLSER